jgi:hypothetical protein
MIRNILIGIGFLLIAISVGGLFLPAEWRVERSVEIDAKPERIYPLIASLKDGWPQWSAFDLEDPDIQYTHEGPNLGTGAKRTWLSKSMGNGSQVISKADPMTGVEFELIMEPNTVKLSGEIRMEVLSGTKTKVTWIDSGRAGFNPFYRIMIRFMDKMIGPVLERSLERLKQM